jgi:hypothetical protein
LTGEDVQSHRVSEFINGFGEFCVVRPFVEINRLIVGPAMAFWPAWLVLMI